MCKRLQKRGRIMCKRLQKRVICVSDCRRGSYYVSAIAQEGSYV